MLPYPNINPVAIQIGQLTIYWYGLMYLLGFAGAFWFCYQLRLKQSKPWTTDNLIDLFFYGALGVIFGGTWGYLLFYEPQTLLEDPLRIVQFWLPGRSFHGGLIGVIAAIWFFCRTYQRHFWEVSDYVARAVPIGLAMGRLGNFMNGELWGRVTEQSWGMVFRNAGVLPRHPSQLYEFALEGVVLFIILLWYARKNRSKGAISGMFLIWYGIFRTLIEFFREPDLDKGFIAFGWVTEGQLLSLPMIFIGLFIVYYAHRKHQINHHKKLFGR